MKLFNLNNQIDIYDNNYIDEKLMEAEEQIKKRYSKDENEICENK